MSDRTLAFLEKFKGDFEKMKQAAPDMVKGFGGLFQSTMKDGALKKKEKELVALGIAVAQRCEPCINLHVQKCLEAGNSAAGNSRSRQRGGDDAGRPGLHAHSRRDRGAGVAGPQGLKRESATAIRHE